MSRQRRPASTSTGHRPDTLVQELLCQRYLLKDKTGRVVETPDGMFRRVAMAVSRAELVYGATRGQAHDFVRRFTKLMNQGLFLPNSPTLMSAGRDHGACLSACFVLPVPDSIDGIFQSVWHTALVQKAGGGTGFDFSSLRPTGDLVASSGGTTSGPISFMRVFAEATNAIQQGAFRRGANMGMMSIVHPDILRFITAKNTPGQFENFNLSVKVPDDFMAAVADRPDESHVVVNPRTGQRYLIPRDINVVTYTIDDLIPVGRAGVPCFTIRDIWEVIVRGAHVSGEPGVCFIDAINRANPTPAQGPIEATNPCGEQPLLAYEACNLGSINLAKFVDRQEKAVRWEDLGTVVNHAVRFLDNVVTINRYPIPEIEDVTCGNRKIGLGLMGFADALLLLGIRYDSNQAVELARRIARRVTEAAHDASERLAAERGTFLNWKASVWDTVHHRRMRNAACTTIAPTGSISILAGCSSGIEPVFSLATERTALGGRNFISVHPLLEELGQHEGWINDRVRSAMLEGVPSAKIQGFPPELADVLVTAHEVTPEWHIRVQAAFQEHIDNAVSKTVNLPANATVEDVDHVFRLAYKLGCKGITVYRDGSRQGQTLSAPRAAQTPTGTVAITPKPRPRVTTGQTFKYRMGCGTLYVTVNRDETGSPCEVFANLGKAGGCPSQSEATCRAVSVALRSGVDPDVLIEQLDGIRCPSTAVARKAGNGIDVLSCPHAIARALREALGKPGEARQRDAISQILVAGRACPHCQVPMRKESGCFVCDACQYSSCG